MLLRNTILKPEKVCILYYGVEIEPETCLQKKRNDARAALQIEEQEIVIGIVGRLEKSKGQHILIEALGRLKNRFPQIRLVIIGEETYGQSGYLEELRRRVDDNGLSTRTIFTGFKKNVTTLSASFGICVLASKKETFGQSLIETMALRIAPIGTNAGGVPEIIEHQKNGILVEPLNCGELTCALETLLMNPDYRERIAIHARRSVENKFLLENHLSGLEKIFKAILH